VKEVIVMDEVDGLSERGGVGEIASIIKKTSTPIICIANEKPPKLRPIINACLDIKFNRPVKSTIATALLKVAKAEKIEITKLDLEGLCEKNGNDIRSILNNLEFYGADIVESKNDKDYNLRLDLFSATQKLIGNKKASLEKIINKH
jgi:replication factor C subunit 1